MMSSPRQRWGLALQYLLLFVLFLRTIWGIWDARDITYGDTSSYFVIAREFAQNLTCVIAWSPLYTSFFGAFNWLTSDPYHIVIWHRIGILVILLVLIFEISRRLLPPLMAWLVTAWWIALPINHGALYEVHLFALIPILVFWLLLACSQSLRMRGICVAVLFLTTVLVRNEILLALGVLGVLSVAWDVWQYWTGSTRRPWWQYLCAYIVPALLVAAFVLVAYQRSTLKYPELSASMKEKHTLNIAQIYCFGYGQRHPEYKDDPWVGYAPLMVSTFGNALPTMGEAIKANPKAMSEHFLWNASLIPSGLQVALFNCRSGAFNPDYIPTLQNSAVATPLSLACLGIIAVGLALTIRHWRYWWENWIRSRAWVLVGIGCVAVTVIVVMLMQRPRPSYLFAFTLPLMWLTAFSLQVIIHHCRLQRVITPLGWVAAFLLTILVPAYYTKAAPAVDTKGKTKKEIVRAKRRLHRQQNRPVLSLLRLVQAHRSEFDRPGTVVGVPNFTTECHNYLGYGHAEARGLLVNTEGILKTMSDNASFSDVLRQRDVNFVVVAPWQLRDPKVKAFMDEAEKLGWKVEKGDSAVSPQYWLYTAPHP